MTERPHLIGLTGSIGMGKSTTAAFFAEAGVPVWDADAAVHRLYRPGGSAVEPLRQLHPAAIRDGAVDRESLKAWIADDPAALPRIEAIVHPLVARQRAKFLKDCAERGADIIVLDIPLLLETSTQATVDTLVVVSAPADIQRARVLARPGMTERHLDGILAKQMPDAEKRRMADVIIPTVDLDEARLAVSDLLSRIRKDRQDA